MNSNKRFGGAVQKRDPEKDRSYIYIYIYCYSTVVKGGSGKGSVVYIYIYIYGAPAILRTVLFKALQYEVNARGHIYI